MKKSMILLLFLKFLIIKSSVSFDDEEFFFKAKCESEKAKTGACFYQIYDSKKNEEYAIFDKCGKGKKCGYDGVCTENLEKRKNGKSCNYDKDCLSRSCKSNKCVTAKENDKCEDIKCEPGLVCYGSYSNLNLVTKCVKPATEGNKPDNTYCMKGLLADYDNKCRKYGTLDDKTVIIQGMELLCKSGLAHRRTSPTVDYICDSLESEPECVDEEVKKAGSWSDGTEIPTGRDSNCIRETDYAGNYKDYYRYSKLKSKLFNEFLNEYNKLDLDKFNSEEGSSLDSGKIGEKKFLYENAPALYAAGIIDSEGKVVSDKKCEYEFIIKHNNSIFIKLKPIILTIIALLF